MPDPQLLPGVLALEETPRPGSLALARGCASLSPDIQGLSPGNMRGQHKLDLLPVTEK